MLGMGVAGESWSVQDGVVSRRQALAAGLLDSDLRRLLRRRELAVVHPGVYVDHTGPLTVSQRTWAAVLHAEPAALYGAWALHVPGERPPAGDVQVAVDEARRPRPLPGVKVRRVVDLAPQVLWNTSPPRQRIEEALLSVCHDAPDELAAIATLADAVQARRTTPRRLALALDNRIRIARRPLLRGVITDLAEGTGSVLEHGYLTRVERAHRLPRGRRQASLSGLRAQNDVRYEVANVLVELDGLEFHTLTRDRYRDLERDIAATLAGYSTVRLGWGQVFGSPCRTAARLGVLLQQRGWQGVPQACSSCPPESRRSRTSAAIE